MKYITTIIKRNNYKTRNIFWHFFLFKKTVCRVYFCDHVKCFWCVQIKTTRFAAFIISILLFISSNWSSMECVTSEKKIDDVLFLFFLLFFNKETANVCPSFHPYCMTDWFYIRWEKETPPRRRRKIGNIAHNSNMVWCAAAAAAAEELLQTTCMDWKRVETLIFFQQPSPHTKIAEVSNNTKGLLSLHRTK